MYLLDQYEGDNNNNNDLQEVHGKHNGDEDPDAKVSQVLLDALLGPHCSCNMPGLILINVFIIKSLS